MSEPVRVAAVDLGATSGRVMACRIGARTLHLEELHRFGNGAVPVHGDLFWDALGIHREVLPEHIANAVFTLCGPDLTHTTGLHVPVDAGVAAAFLR